MKIRIIHGYDGLPEHVRDMGVKVGEEYDAEPVPGSRLDAVRFKVIVDDDPEYCMVMPKNYKKI